MSETVFLFKPHGHHDKHTVVEVSGEEASQLIDEDKAVRIEFGKYDSFRQRAQQVHREFIEEEQKVRQSDNPLYQQKEIRDYELDKIRHEYEEKSKEIEAEWREYRARYTEEARARSAQASVKVTQSDRDTAEQFANRLALRIAANPSSAGQILSEARSDISLLTDGQKVALQGKLADILTGIEGNASQKAALIEEAQDVRNMDLLAVKAAQYLPATPALEYRQTRIVRGWK